METTNKMGTMPINRLLLSMSLPMVAAMLVQALYNIVDSMFVAQLSENALTAVSLAFPVQNLMIAVSTGTGVGMNALISRALGEGNRERANLIANNGVYLAIFSTIAFALLAFFGSELFFRMQTDDLDIIQQGTIYIQVCSCLSFGIFLQIAFDRILQATGRTFYTMLTQGLGAILNIILDPILIFGLFGLPRMGIAGAALATVLGQMAAAALSLWYNKKKNDDIVISPKKYGLSSMAIKKIYAIGIPSICMASIGSIMTFGMNKILISFTSTATAVFGVYFKLQSFIFMPVFGLNNGMVPIVAYNYGARNPERIMRTIKLSMLYATAIMALGFLAFQFFSPQLLRIFNASEQMLEIGTVALRTISFSFLLAGFNIISTSFYQALGHGFLSLAGAVLRQLVVLLPVAILMAKIQGLSAVWLAFPAAEISTLVFNIFFVRYIYRKELRTMPKKETPEMA